MSWTKTARARRSADGARVVAGARGFNPLSEAEAAFGALGGGALVRTGWFARRRDEPDAGQ